MDEGSEQVEQKSFEPGDVLTDAADIYREHWKTLVTAALVVIVPAQAVSAAIIVAVKRTDLGPIGIIDVPLVLLGTLLVGMLPLTTAVIAGDATTHAIAVAHVGGQPDWRRSLHYVKHRLGAVVVTSIVFCLGVAIGIALLVVPGIWLAVTWSLVGPIVLLEHSSPGDAFRRSGQLAALLVGGARHRGPRSAGGGDRAGAHRAPAPFHHLGARRRHRRLRR